MGSIWEVRRAAMTIGDCVKSENYAFASYRVVAVTLANSNAANSQIAPRLVTGTRLVVGCVWPKVKESRLACNGTGDWRLTGGDNQELTRNVDDDVDGDVVDDR